MRVAFIICGALGHEVQAIIEKYGWEADVYGVPALDHVFPERIAPDVEARILELRAQYERLIVVLGDCGSKGVLDKVLAQHHVERLEGPHCYEMYGGEGFHKLMEEELGSFFLTDYLVRGFEGTIVRGMGLDRQPELRDMYFQHYKRVVYLAQKPTAVLVAQAQQAADYLGLPLVVKETGYGLLEERLVALMTQTDPLVHRQDGEEVCREVKKMPARLPKARHTRSRQRKVRDR